MNKLFYAALAAVPAICVTSCSDPSESASSDVESLLDDVKACIKENESATDEELIAALHDCVVPKLESITSAVEDMDSDAKFEFLKKYHLEENASIKSLQKVVKEEMKRRFDTRSDFRVWQKLPKGAKVQIIEMGEAFAKLGVTVMGDAKVLKQQEEYWRKKSEEMRARLEAESKAEEARHQEEMEKARKSSGYYY